MLHRFSREELYELVWSSPMSKLAKRLGVSDVGLAKACRRADIPLPGVGYWAKLQYGKKVPRIPLPPSTPKTPAYTWGLWIRPPHRRHGFWRCRTSHCLFPNSPAAEVCRFVQGELT
jgi:hypothetical protein